MIKILGTLLLHHTAAPPQLIHDFLSSNRHPPIMPTDHSFMPDLPSHLGPLTDYRKCANFDWKALRVYFESEDCLRAKYAIWHHLETEPLFKPSSTTPSVDDQKRLAAMRMKRVLELELLPDDIKNSAYPKRVSLNGLEAWSCVAIKYS